MFLTSAKNLFNDFHLMRERETEEKHFFLQKYTAFCYSYSSSKAQVRKKAEVWYHIAFKLSTSGSNETDCM